jgi:hypothetical protein
VKLLGDNIDIIKKNTETLINIEKTKYMLLSCHQYVDQNRDIKTANRLFENLSQLKYLLREEHRLMLFENMVLKRIFGPKRGEVTKEWRKVHNELCNFYSSPSIIRMTKSRRMR